MLQSDSRADYRTRTSVLIQADYDEEHPESISIDHTHLIRLDSVDQKDLDDLTTIRMLREKLGITSHKMVWHYKLGRNGQGYQVRAGVLVDLLGPYYETLVVDYQYITAPEVSGSQEHGMRGVWNDQPISKAYIHHIPPTANLLHGCVQRMDHLVLHFMPNSFEMNLQAILKAKLQCRTLELVNIGITPAQQKVLKIRLPHIPNLVMTNVNNWNGAVTGIRDIPVNQLEAVGPRVR